MTSPNVEILRGLLAIEDGKGPDAIAAALFTHPLIGQHIPFTFDLVRDSIANNEQVYCEIVQGIAGEIATRIAVSIKQGLRQ